jgi:hypothetical protein
MFTALIVSIQIQYSNKKTMVNRLRLNFGYFFVLHPPFGPTFKKRQGHAPGLGERRGDAPASRGYGQLALTHRVVAVQFERQREPIRPQRDFQPSTRFQPGSVPAGKLQSLDQHPLKKPPAFHETNRLEELIFRLRAAPGAGEGLPGTDNAHLQLCRGQREQWLGSGLERRVLCLLGREAASVQQPQ